MAFGAKNSDMSSVQRVTRKSSKGNVDGVNPENLATFDINCAFSRRFHVYRSPWKPTNGEKLKMEQEYGNMHDPFAISIFASLRG